MYQVDSGNLKLADIKSQLLNTIIKKDLHKMLDGNT